MFADVNNEGIDLNVSHQIIYMSAIIRQFQVDGKHTNLDKNVLAMHLIHYIT